MRIAVAVIICLSFFSAEAAQQHASLAVDVDRVNVLLTVANRKGRLVRNLGPDDFKVFEDGRLQNISNFSSEAGLPLNIALLIDSSGSVRDKVRFERQAAVRFFCSALRPGKDRALFVRASSKISAARLVWEINRR